MRLDTSSSNTAFSAAYGAFASGSRTETTNLIAVSALLLLLGISLTRLEAVLIAFVQNLAFTGLGILALGSFLWSQFPMRSLFNGALILANIAFAFFLVKRFPPESRLRLLLIVGWIVVLASICAAVLFPGYGLDHRGEQEASGTWVGIFRHKNWCAIMVAFLLSPALYLPAIRPLAKLGRTTFILLSLILIYQTQSRTGWVVTIVMLAFFACERVVASFSRRDRFTIIATGSAFAAGMAAMLWQSSGTIFLLLGKNSSLTGRTGIWQLAFRSVMKHPFLGYGYSAFWSGLQGESANVSLADHWIVPAAHNGFLDLWLGLGAAGLLLFAVAVFRATREGTRCLRQPRSRFVAWCLCVVVMTIVANVSEGTIMTPNHLAWIIFVIACVGLHEEASRGHREKME